MLNVTLSPAFTVIDSGEMNPLAPCVTVIVYWLLLFGVSGMKSYWIRMELYALNLGLFVKSL